MKAKKLDDSDDVSRQDLRVVGVGGGVSLLSSGVARGGRGAAPLPPAYLTAKSAHPPPVITLQTCSVSNADIPPVLIVSFV